MIVDRRSSIVDWTAFNWQSSIGNRQFRSGFTATELLMALIITSMVMSAIAGFSLAMSTAWKSAEKSQAISVLGNQVVTRLENEIRKARLIGACRAGSSDESAGGAAIMLWMADTNGDGFIQGDECEMIEHDPATHTLRCWYFGQADATGTWSCSTTFTNSTVLSTFKQDRQYHKMAGGVYGAVFQACGTSGTSLNPSLSFGLKLMVDDSQAAIANSRAVGGEPKLMVEYGTATVRAPIATPTN
jgi:type II secretory pathway component PulJ